MQPRELKNTGRYTYLMVQINDYEVCIYDAAGFIVAREFDSFEHAQIWYDKYCEINNGKKSLNAGPDKKVPSFEEFLYQSKTA